MNKPGGGGGFFRVLRLFPVFFRLDNSAESAYSIIKNTREVIKLSAGEARRKSMATLLKMSDTPIPGQLLAEKFGVSRQIIVRDISALRDGGLPVVSTNRGYFVETKECRSRTVKVRHTDEETGDELMTVVELGGTVVDVFVKHRVYGELRAPLHVSTRLDVARFLEDIRSGKSTPLKNITSGYHYHTIEAESEAVLDAITEALRKKKYMAERLYYEEKDD